MKRTITIFAAILAITAIAACGKREEPALGAPHPAAVELAPAADFAAAADGITAEDLLGHIATLAADEFGGRAPMSEGERLTLDYLENEFRAMGLDPMFEDSYRQPVPLVAITANPDMPLVVSSPDGKIHASYAYGPEAMMWTTRVVEETGIEDSELVWVGYGIVAPEYGWNDYANFDVHGKTVLMLVNDPGYATGDPGLFKGSRMTYYGRWTYKYEEAARQGAAGALIVHQTAPAAYGWNVVEDSNTGPKFHLVSNNGNTDRAHVEGWVQEHVAKEILGMAGLEFEALQRQAAQGSSPPRPLGLNASISVRNTLAYAESFNVGAVRQGATAPDELFMYMAHWDHLGTGPHKGAETGDNIFNGAEDNASGTSGLLEIAKAFSELNSIPRRTVGFLAVTAEESGLLGSQAYTENPAWPMHRTVAGINMDRLNFRGRMSDVVVIGHGASEMEDVLADEAIKVGRTVTPEATPEKGFYYRSDHFNFAKRGVPILYARGGTTDREHGAEYVAQRNADYIANRYHSPSDEVHDSWVVDGAVEDLRLFFAIGHRIANSDEWPRWYEGNEFRAVREASLAQ